MILNTDRLKEKLEHYINNLEDLERSQKTLKNYYKSNELFIKYLTNKNIERIDQNNINHIIEKYRNYLKHQQNNKVSTRKRYLREIIQFLGTLGLKITIELPKDKYKNEKIKYLTNEEIQEVLKTIPKSMIRDRTIFQMLYRTGLRVSELSNLKKQDINLNSEEEAISISVFNGKGGKDRTVYIDQETLKLLNLMIYKRTRKNKKDKRDYLFTSKNGKQLKVRDIQRMVKKYAMATDKRLTEKGYKTNFKDRLTPHTLRHSFAIHLLNEAERPINEVQTLLGHSNISTTNTYTKIDDKKTKKGYQKIKW